MMGRRFLTILVLIAIGAWPSDCLPSSGPSQDLSYRLTEEVASPDQIVETSEAISFLPVGEGKDLNWWVVSSSSVRVLGVLGPYAEIKTYDLARGYVSNQSVENLKASLILGSDRVAVFKDFVNAQVANRTLETKMFVLATEGDDVPPRTVELDELLESLPSYHGKRIRVSGYFRGDFEGRSFSRNLASTRNYDQALWVGGWSKFSDEYGKDFPKDQFVQFEGVLDTSQTGHRNLWPASIQRITRVEPLGLQESQE